MCFLLECLLSMNKISARKCETWLLTHPSQWILFATCMHSLCLQGVRAC